MDDAIPTEVIRFGGSVRATCNSGYTTTGQAGGDDTFTMSCQANDMFSNTNEVCERPLFTVRGLATDAQSASMRLQDCRVVFIQDGVTMATAYTDRSGRYTARVPQGLVTIHATKDGYIQQELELQVESMEWFGQGGDLALSRVLPPGSWRVVVTWGAHSRDLDSHTYFGNGGYTHVYWPGSRRSASAAGTGGIRVTLDRDDVNGFGPETTTFSNVGHCTQPGKCLIKFKVKNYSRRDGNLGDSQCQITVYRGNEVAGTYTIPPSVGSAIWYSVFTLDATSGAQTVLYDGERSLPPTLDATRV